VITDDRREVDEARHQHQPTAVEEQRRRPPEPHAEVRCPPRAARRHPEQAEQQREKTFSTRRG
jgi:hypothetical protein